MDVRLLDGPIFTIGNYTIMCYLLLLISCDNS